MSVESFISQRCHAVDASGIRKVFDLGAKLTDPINLSIGQPDFDVPDAAKAAAIEAIRSGRNGYTLTQGIPELRARIEAALIDEFGPLGDARVLVTSGVSGGILLSLMALLNPGDEVVCLDPYFVIYKHAVRLLGGVPVFVDTYPDFRLHPDRIEAAITPRTKVLILASPSNPTGVVLSAEEMKQAADIAERHNLILISDEIYCQLSYDGTAPSGWREARHRTLLLRGFSKSAGMTGWRLGYAAGPRPLIEAMTKLQQYTFVCAPSMVQYAGLAAMDVDITVHVDEFRARRKFVHGALRDYYEIVRPGGGFYFFPKVPDGYASATAFVERAIENGLLIIPGNVFSERDTHFRISYAAEQSVLHRGCDVLRRLARP
ncbi:MAG: aminotransferase class I/II-fold pyridoxal phosphate-dependent enzyme [Phycisphaerae bacterium]|nr:aminotransferase class I/II-fold pyridoxal phosphate-dependent enzyme [Phycisphaerae bacterium]